ncbi:MAG: DMT family transporter [Syntrophomonas sp.]
MFNHFSDRVSGALYIILSAFLYATLPILAKFSYQAGLAPENVLLLRYFFAFSMVFLYLKLYKKEPVLTRSPLAILQGILLIISGMAYFFSLCFLSASITTVIFFSHPVLVSLFSMLFFKEKYDYRLITGLALALTGIFLVSNITGSDLKVSLSGFLLAFASSIMYAFYSLLSQKNVTQVPALSLSATFFLIATVSILAIFHNVSFVASLTPKQVLIGFIIALFNTILAVSCFLKGVKKIGASRSSLISTLEPVITLLLAFLLLKEVLSPLQILGSSLVLVSMFLSITSLKVKQS